MSRGASLMAGLPLCASLLAERPPSPLQIESEEGITRIVMVADIFTAPGFTLTHLTDETWKSRLLTEGPPPRPDWTRAYLAPQP